MAKQHDKQFKLDAVQYYQDHKDLGVRGCAENLGIGYSTLTKWLKDFRESGDIPVRGFGNYNPMRIIIIEYLNLRKISLCN